MDFREKFSVINVPIADIIFHLSEDLRDYPKKMKMEHHHISSVCDKLTNYASNINYSIGYIVVKYSYVALQKHLHYKKELDEIANILKATKNYTNIRKTLYISTDKVLDPDINQYIKMIKPNIFRYKDMKIVISKI